MDIHFKIIGILFILLALIHIIFPKYFNWEQELSSLSLMNRQMMIIHTFFIALIVGMMGLLCLTSYRELIDTHLGKQICLGFGIFWSIRLLIQFWGYSPELWKGRLFETITHIVFSFFWFYVSTVFLLTYMY